MFFYIKERRYPVPTAGLIVRRRYGTRRVEKTCFLKRKVSVVLKSTIVTNIINKVFLIHNRDPAQFLLQA